MRHFCAMRSLKLQARLGSRCVERDPRALGDGKAVEQGKGVVAIMAELCQLGRGKGRSIRDVDRERIHMPPVLQEFIVKMGAGGETGRADSADDLPLLHVRAGPDVGRNGAQVRVPRPNLSRMAKLDKPAIRPRESRPRDDARCGGLDRRSRGRAVVDPLVRPPELQNGVKAASREVAGDAVGYRIA